MQRLIPALLVFLGFAGLAQAQPAARALEELRSSIGTWNVTTHRLAPDGSIRSSAEGRYQFRWVIPDKVAQGWSSIPDWDLRSGLLFYLRESTNEIEMVSVGDDGKLWIMAGEMGDDARYSQEYETPRGKTSQLRFTRSNVETDRFESHMHYSNDGGESWIAANHQIFVRRVTEEAAPLPSIDLPANLDRVLRDYESAWTARDAAGLASLFTEDGFVLSPGRAPVHGREAIEARYQGSGGDLALRAFHYQVEGDSATILGGYAGQAGQPDTGKFTLTLRKSEGRWWIVSDMDNSNRER